MPDQLGGKVLTATLKNGKALCSEFLAEPMIAPSVLIYAQSCSSLAGPVEASKSVIAASTVPAATLVPAALGEKAQFTRKRAAADATDDEVASAMRAAVKKAQRQNPRANQKANQQPCPREAVVASKLEPNWIPIWRGLAWAQVQPRHQLDLPQRRQDCLSRATDATDRAQVPRRGPADLLLPTRHDERWHQALPTVPTRRMQSQAMPSGSPSLCSSYSKRSRLWSLQPWCHKLQRQALTHARGGGGCFFWVKWLRAARGATSYGRPDGWPQHPSPRPSLAADGSAWQSTDLSHDLADEKRQELLSGQLEEVIFIAATIDCSTKSRAREIPRRFEDGHRAPGPLRWEAYPDGLPNLPTREAKRVEIDNKACDYVLRETQQLRDRGGGCVRENPAMSFHWWTSTEVTMWNSLTQPAHSGGSKHQLLRHNIMTRLANGQWPTAIMCMTLRSGFPYTCNGRRIYLPRRKRSIQLFYAVLAFAIAG